MSRQPQRDVTIFTVTGKLFIGYFQPVRALYRYYHDPATSTIKIQETFLRIG
jgi:hypothetical protein